MLLMLLYLPASLKESKLFRDITVRKAEKRPSSAADRGGYLALVLFFVFYARNVIKRAARQHGHATRR